MPKTVDNHQEQLVLVILASKKGQKTEIQDPEFVRHSHRFLGKSNFWESIGPKKVLKLPFLFRGGL